jgi:hypothetical protein
MSTIARFALIQILATLTLAAPASAGAARPSSAGGIAVGESQGGVTDRAYVSAPPGYAYTIARESGSFLDCGEGDEARQTDASGRDMASLSCGVTLTETIVIPAAADSARIIVHY